MVNESNAEALRILNKPPTLGGNRKQRRKKDQGTLPDNNTAHKIADKESLEETKGPSKQGCAHKRQQKKEEKVRARKDVPILDPEEEMNDRRFAHELNDGNMIKIHDMKE